MSVAHKLLFLNEVKHDLSKTLRTKNERNMKKYLITGLATGLFFCGVVGSVNATTVTAHITADNHYGLYFGNTSSLQYVGRNETGSAGNPGQYNWTLPETFVFNVLAGDYLYMAAWDDGGPQMLTADFYWGAGTVPKLVTDANNWEYIQGGNTPLDQLGSPPVTISNMMTAISSATWLSVGQALAYNSSPWGNISGVDDSAKFIWGDDTQNGTGFQIFRTKAPVEPVPEPATMLLFGTGLVGLAGLKRRKKN